MTEKEMIRFIEATLRNEELRTATQKVLNDTINSDHEFEVKLNAHKTYREDDHKTYVNTMAGHNVAWDNRKFGKLPANEKELWKADMPKKEVKESNKKVVIKPKFKKTRKTFKGIPEGTYIPETPQVSEVEYKPTLKDFNDYMVLDYTIYRYAVVIEVVDAYSVRSSYNNRELEEKNQLTTKIVFRYQPWTVTGKPNPYDGFTQMKDWLKTLPCVTSTEPTTIKEALEALVGNVVNIPNVTPYNYAGSDTSHAVIKGEVKTFNRNTKTSDKLTVFSVFGDFDTFANEFDIIEERKVKNHSCLSSYQFRCDLV